MTRITIVHHGQCFDGVSSSALLARFLRERHPDAQFTYHGLTHQPGGSFVPEDVLDGEINAIVDFRYSVSRRLDWFFDHHQSGVNGRREMRSLVESQKIKKGKRYYDPDYGSCCMLIADVLHRDHSYSDWHTAELIHWADKFDTADFKSAKEATSLELPAQKVARVLLGERGDAFCDLAIRALVEGQTLEDISELSSVRAVVDEAQRAQRRAMQLVEQHCEMRGDVVLADLRAEDLERYPRFLSYVVHPGARYAVGAIATDDAVKISVGFNPWGRGKREHNVAALCERFGGGGHPYVGGISIPLSRSEDADRAMREILAALNSSP